MSARTVIVIDPGHGGAAAAGGSSPNHARGPNGLLEKDVVLDLARRVRARLGGFDVRLTRDADTNMALATRCAFARNADAGAFVSLHLNGAMSESVDGTEAWVARDASPRSRSLADALVRSIASVARVEPRGVRERNLGVLVPGRHSSGTAACLVEALFLSNPRQARQLENDGYRDALAGAIADSLRAAFGQPAIALQAQVAPLTHQEVLDEAQRILGNRRYATYQDYLATLVNGTVFGQGVRVRPEFLRKLQAAETAARARISDFGISTIGSFENRLGLHGFGLAIDIDANRNPYVMHESGETRRDTELRRIYNRIALMMTGRASCIPDDITRGRINDAARTAQLFDVLQNESNAMRSYWALLDRDSLADYLRNIPTRDWRAILGDDRQPTVDILLPIIARDYVVLAGRPGPAHPGVTYPAAPQLPGDPPFVRRDPANGFMNLKRAVVLALSAQRLRWGAIDLAGASGDIMHFDDGVEGLGAALVSAHHTLRRQREQQARGQAIIPREMPGRTPAPRPAQAPPPQRPDVREEYNGRPFTPASNAALFRCAPTPVNVIAATLLPRETNDPDASIRYALAQNGVAAADIDAFNTNGGFAPLRPIAEFFGGAALAELMARLRYTAARLVSPPHGHGRDLNTNLGIRNAAEILAPRLLVAIPGHFRELARRAPDPVEAHALENLGWLIMRSLRSRVSSATGKNWWLPAAPQFVTPFSSTLPAFTAQVQRLVMRTLLIDDTLSFADYNARVRAWQNGLPGRQWQRETGRTADPAGVSLPFYPALVTVPAAINTAPLVTQIDNAWTTRLAETDARFPAGSPENTRALKECDNGRLSGLRLTSTIALNGVELVTRWPVLESQAPRFLVRTLAILRAAQPTVQQVFDTLGGMGWNDLVFETQGAFCFRGNKIQGNDAAARRLSNHGRALAVDVMVFENPQGQATSTHDPRIVRLFESHHCRWGRCFPTPDPHHFEYCGTAC